MSEFTYSSKKQICPCGQSKNYTPLTSHTSGGKCHSTKCGQKFFPPEQPYQNDTITHQKVYAYRDEQGKTLFETVRYYKDGKKSFYQRRPTINGTYIKGLGNVQRVLYNLPEVQRAIANKQEIFLVEGEKDCETLTKQGFVATCNPMGAGKWRNEYTEMLQKALVIIIPDNDEAGKQHGNTIVQALYGIATSVKIVHLPKLPPKGDISDWLGNGNTVEKLREIVSTTPEYKKGESILPQKERAVTNDYRSIEETTRNNGKPTKWYDVERHLQIYYRFFYNELTAEITVSKHSEDFRPTGLPQITDKFVANLRRNLALCGLPHSDDLVRSVILASAEPFHPFKSFFSHLPAWDGHDHIGKFAAQVQTVEAHRDAWHTYFRRWLIALVACSLTGRANHSILLLQGAQGIGKSRFFNSLIPGELHRYYSGSESLTEQTADVKLLLAERLLLVLDEVESTSRADLNFLNSTYKCES